MSGDDTKLPPGTGTGPAGGAAVKPTPPARDPAAEAAALAEFEAEQKELATKDALDHAAPASPAIAAGEPATANPRSAASAPEKKASMRNGTFLPMPRERTISSSASDTRGRR